ncbi:MAG TPA: amidohydrolase family protein, partial [Acidimicrobiia bacterium]|nr:amidohydrolase family protein [Acidimicrobiia bacterium]
SMDPNVGDHERGDVLIEGETITRIGPSLQAESASEVTTIVDAEGCIVMPGFVDTHRHMWQGQLRRMIPNVDISMYLGLRNAFAVQYEPRDNYAGTLAIALGALYSGITSIQDYAHNTRSSSHADAEVEALTTAGIRAVYACAPPEAGEWERQWPEDLSRLNDELAGHPLMTLRMGQRCFSDEDNLTPERIRIARDLGIGMTLDPVAWEEGTNAILDVASAGLLGPDLTFVHCFDLSAEAWKSMGDADVRVSLSPFVDELLGWGPEGLPTVQRALDVGIDPGLSVDIETTVPCDVFTQMRALLAVHRMRGSLGNTEVERPQMTAKEALAVATTHGARTIGLEDVCGTLTPGKKADVVLIDCSTPNIFPLSNAYGTVALGADVNAVRAVLVAGEFRKWGDHLVGVDLAEIHEMIETSRDSLCAKVGFEIDLFADYPSIDLGTHTLRM